jgi:hypothetical protein
VNEMKLLEDFCAEEAQPGPERLARSRARLMTAIEDGQHSGSVPLGRPRTTRMVSLALSATAVGTAGALAIVSLAAGGKPVSPGGSHAPAGLLAGQPARPFLLAMAGKAAQQKTGRFYCTTEVQGDRELVGVGGRLLPEPWLNGPNRVPTSAPGGFRYALTRRYRITQCTRVSDVTRLTISMQYLGARPASGADARAWRRDGSPGHWRRGHGVLSAQPGPVDEVQSVKHGAGDFGGKNDLWLPANPARLRTVFLTHPQPGAKGRNNVIAAGALTVMNADSVRPAVRAAAFRVLASVPGVRMRPGVTDPEGQTGTAVWQDSWIGAYLRYETSFVIIDPQTGSVLGSETVAQTPVAGAAPGTVLFYSATTGARWTGQLPPPTP